MTCRFFPPPWVGWRWSPAARSSAAGFGDSRPAAARKAVAAEAPGSVEASSTAAALVRRLQSYANGHREDFRNVRLNLGGLTDFQRRVLTECRKIPYGRTCTYGELAQRPARRVPPGRWGIAWRPIRSRCSFHAIGWLLRGMVWGPTRAGGGEDEATPDFERKRCCFNAEITLE